METQEQSSMPLLWTKKEAGAYLRKSVRSISRYLADGKIKGFKLGENGDVLVYAETVTEENLNSIKPKFNNKFR
ncbi:hypothetical protein [Flavobacterium sp.]|uniref:hypothetical protein n=1 Tax=Flavobacterium sp. TaxID=239 RepID=UPI0024899A6E|nr:hypothetical protein [Flavobacterium sp.]MDI1317915.1 hypothetical protein [Flavobacterium sp.]